MNGINTDNTRLPSGVCEDYQTVRRAGVEGNIRSAVAVQVSDGQIDGEGGGEEADAFEAVLKAAGAVAQQDGNGEGIAAEDGKVRRAVAVEVGDGYLRGAVEAGVVYGSFERAVAVTQQDGQY